MKDSNFQDFRGNCARTATQFWSWQFLHCSHLINRVGRLHVWLKKLHQGSETIVQRLPQLIIIASEMLAVAIK